MYYLTIPTTVPRILLEPLTPAPAVITCPCTCCLTFTVSRGKVTRSAKQAAVPAVRHCFNRPGEFCRQNNDLTLREGGGSEF